MLVAVADRIEHDPDRLLDAALDAPDLAALQRQLNLPLREFNATLSTLGVRYPAIDYSQQHAEEFSDHLRRHRDRLLDRLRWARLGRFTAFIPQPDWPYLRRIESIVTPAPEWGTTVDTLSPALIDERVEEELTRLLGAVPPASGPPLPRLSDCAKANADLINGAASTLVKIVRAWLVRQENRSAVPGLMRTRRDARCSRPWMRQVRWTSPSWRTRTPCDGSRRSASGPQACPSQTTSAPSGSPATTLTTRRPKSGASAPNKPGNSGSSP